MARGVAMFFALIALVAGASLASAVSYPAPAPSYPTPAPLPRKYTELKINVGGSKNWTFGVNYSRWAFRKGSFFINDTLVFKYQAPSKTNIHPHSVYLLPDFQSFKNCDFTKAVKLADEHQGVGSGFEFKLKEWQPYYFACGASEGYHCKHGSMKFFVFAQYRRWA